MKPGRAWKAKGKVGDDHYKRCHAVDTDDEITLCGIILNENWIYDSSGTDKVTCSKCNQKIDY
jgi:hypothetical protein